MQIVTSITDMQARVDSLRKSGKRIGFVPTMGFLHAGHLSLMGSMKKAALALFPDKESVYDLAYAPRLKRIIAERFIISGG